MSRVAYVVLTVAFATTAPLKAQETTLSIPPVSIPSDHWVYPLLDRMAADGLLEAEWLPGRRPVGGGVIATALDSAVARVAEAGRPGREGRPAEGWLETVRAARAWLHDEYGLPSGSPVRIVPTSGARFAAGPLTDPSQALGGAEVLLRPVSNVGVWAEPILELGGEGVGLPTPRMGASWSPGPVRVTADYGGHRLGIGASGGMVLHDRAELPWVELALDEPTRLPWLLRYLGPFQISVAGSGIGADSLGSAVGVFTGEFRIHPFPWFTGEMSRSAVVTWERNGRRITLRDVISTILGTRSGTTDNFDDQKASMTYLFRFRIAGVAVNPYAVWAWEDTWQIDQDPGTMLGVWLPAIHVAERPVGVRYEYTAFGDAGRIFWPWSKLWDWRNWYRHSNRDRYVNGEGEMLGHPLGGYGIEHRVEVELPMPRRDLLLDIDLYTRDRIAGTAFQEKDSSTISFSNLFYDELPGRSWGGGLQAVVRTARLTVTGSLAVEVGAEGWDRTTGSVRARWLFP